MPTVKAYIALGSNLGNREATLQAALAELDRTPGVKIIETSTFIETPPMGQAGQRHYLNAAVGLRTTLEPRELLDRFLAIEAQQGRRRSERTRWGSRELDIDLLLYGDRVIDEPGLTVPHPHMHERAFVLEPLAEIAPDVVHPVLGKSVGELLAAVARVTK